MFPVFPDANIIELCIYLYYLLYMGIVITEWHKVNPITGCWIWLRARFTQTGYGCKRVNGKSLTAHSIYWEAANGKIPDGKVIDHLCQNRLCVNPAHMELVTTAVNIQRSTKTHLTPDAVREIRQRYVPYKKGHRHSPEMRAIVKDLETKYNVSRDSIICAAKRKTWKNIP